MITPAATPATPPAATPQQHSWPCPLCEHPNYITADTCYGCGLTAPEIMEILGELGKADTVDPPPPRVDEFEALFEPKEIMGG